MSEPLIQVVDGNDRPIRAANKEEVWKSGEIHRIAWVIIEGSDGRILLQKRPKTMALYPGCWDNSMGGHVDSGESWIEAARRELEEELGIKTAKLIELGKFYKEGKFEGRKLNRFYKTYKLLTSQKEFDFDEHEVDEVRWFSLNETRDLIKNEPNEVTDGLKEVIARYYS